MPAFFLQIHLLRPACRPDLCQTMRYLKTIFFTIKSEEAGGQRERDDIVNDAPKITSASDSSAC